MGRGKLFACKNSRSQTAADSRVLKCNAKVICEQWKPQHFLNSLDWVTRSLDFRALFIRVSRRESKQKSGSVSQYCSSWNALVLSWHWRLRVCYRASDHLPFSRPSASHKLCGNRCRNSVSQPCWRERPLGPCLNQHTDSRRTTSHQIQSFRGSVTRDCLTDQALSGTRSSSPTGEARTKCIFHWIRRFVAPSVLISPAHLLLTSLPPYAGYHPLTQGPESQFFCARLSMFLEAPHHKRLE
jgi:hypothetical protein